VDGRTGGRAVERAGGRAVERAGGRAVERAGGRADERAVGRADTREKDRGRVTNRLDFWNCDGLLLKTFSDSDITFPAFVD